MTQVQQAFINGFVKRADEKRDRLVMRLLGLGAFGGGVLVNAAVGHRLNKIMEDTPDLPKAKIPSVYKAVGIDPKFPTYPYPHMRNAAYVSPGDAHLVADQMKAEGVLGQTSSAENERMKRLGLIAYDPNYNKAGIMAHEAGHAAIRTTKPWYSPSRINQGPLRMGSDILGPLLSTAAGGYVGAATKSPLYGALAGAGAGAISALPTLINEYQASNYARKYLDQANHHGATVAKNKKALNRAFMTYLLGSTVSPALFGAAVPAYFNSQYGNNYTPGF